MAAAACLAPRFDLEEKIGAGTFGVVHAAYDRDTGAHVAIKRVDGVFKMGAESAVVVVRELRALRALRDSSARHAVRVLHAEAVPGALHIVLERMHCDLRAALRNFVLCESARLHLSRQLLQAVHDLHALGFAHRDLSCANVLLQPDATEPGGVRLALCDFGMAVGSCEPVRPSVWGSYVTTRWYRAPEVCAAERPLQRLQDFQRADMWSVGCVLAEVMGSGDGSALPRPLLPGADSAHQALLTRDEALLRERLSGLLPSAGADGVDLLRGLLRADPVSRLTAQQALQHAFARRCRDACGGLASPAPSPSPAAAAVALSRMQHELEPDLTVSAMRKVLCAELAAFVNRAPARAGDAAPAPAAAAPPVERRRRLRCRRSIGSGISHSCGGGSGGGSGGGGGDVGGSGSPSRPVKKLRR
jgi:serine/threonine protein kinase